MGCHDKPTVRDVFFEKTPVVTNCLLGQWLNFKLFGITYLVGKISPSNGFISGSEMAK